MRPLIVEAVDEVVEPGLLLKEIGACRFGGFVLQSEVHAFMASVLLRAARLMRSMSMPKRNHQTDSLLRLNSALANNAAEWALRGFTLGRKAWLFSAPSAALIAPPSWRR